MSKSTSRLHSEAAADEAYLGARQYLDKAGEKMREMRYGASDLASRGLSAVGDTAAAARARVGDYAYATRTYVAEKPVQSALIAAAVGAVVAAAIVMARRRSNDYY